VCSPTSECSPDRTPRTPFLVDSAVFRPGTTPRARTPAIGLVSLRDRGQSRYVGGIRRLRVLLSEGSSLTSREIITALGPAGHELDVMDPDPLCLARFSRWVRRIVRCPAVGRDPRGYMDAVSAQLRRRRYDVLLPTHEQAYLFGILRHQLPPEVGLAVSDAPAFARVQSKVAFAQLLEDLGLPQPAHQRVEHARELESWSYPYLLKAAHSTAGQGVRLVRDDRERAQALAALWPAPAGLLVQAPASGTYGQVQALLQRGRLIAAHTCVATATGMGGSAAGRIGVDHAQARADVARIGEALAWHGGLTLDYFWCEQTGPLYLECNPRTVEPGNAVASGVPLPELQLRLSLGEMFDGPPVIGRPGVRTHSLMAICLGAADRSARRGPVVARLAAALAGRGPYRSSREILTPVRSDPVSVLPLGFVLARLLARPAAASRIASHAVGAYSLSPETVTAISGSADAPPRAGAHTRS
jgi:hypothetical protein